MTRETVLVEVPNESDTVDVYQSAGVSIAELYADHGDILMCAEGATQWLALDALETKLAGMIGNVRAKKRLFLEGK